MHGGGQRPETDGLPEWRGSRKVDSMVPSEKAVLRRHDGMSVTRGNVAVSWAPPVPHNRCVNSFPLWFAQRPIVRKREGNGANGDLQKPWFVNCCICLIRPGLTTNITHS